MDELVLLDKEQVIDVSKGEHPDRMSAVVIRLTLERKGEWIDYILYLTNKEAKELIKGIRENL